jgi:hypothetical protein
MNSTEQALRNRLNRARDSISNKNIWNNLVNVKLRSFINNGGSSGYALRSVNTTARMSIEQLQAKYLNNVKEAYTKEKKRLNKLETKTYLIKQPWHVVNANSVTTPVVLPGYRKQWIIQWGDRDKTVIESVNRNSNASIQHYKVGNINQTNCSIKICNKITASQTVYKKGIVGLSVMELSTIITKYLRGSANTNGRRLEIRKMLLELKRNGDYLQILMCHKVNNGLNFKIVKPGSVEVAVLKRLRLPVSFIQKKCFSKCMFWTIDIPAAFFAILMGVPTVLQGMTSPIAYYYYDGRPLLLNTNQITQPFLKLILDEWNADTTRDNLSTLHMKTWYQKMCAFDSAHDFIKPGDRCRVAAPTIYTIISAIDPGFAQILLLNNGTLTPSKQVQNERYVREYITSTVMTQLPDNMFERCLAQDMCINRDSGKLRDKLALLEANLSAKFIDPGY